MLKYHHGCKRDLEIDKFYSYKKSICKQCVNKKVICDYCEKEFKSTKLSKHIKQINSTSISSRANDSTSNNSTSKKTNKNNSTSKKTNKNNSTSNKKDKNNIIDEKNEPLYPTIEDGLYLNKYNKLMKDKVKNFDIKTQGKINRILTKNRMLHDKVKNNTITKREEEQYENNLNKLKGLDYFDERVCKILLKYKYLD